MVCKGKCEVVTTCRQDYLWDYGFHSKLSLKFTLNISQSCNGGCEWEMHNDHNDLIKNIVRKLTYLSIVGSEPLSQWAEEPASLVCSVIWLT